MDTLDDIAAQLFLILRPEIQTATPHVAVFDGGRLIRGENEIAVEYPKIGALFITVVAGQVVVEATAIADKGEPRSVVQPRHEELLRRAGKLFGEDNIDHHDPLGLRNGVPTSSTKA